MPDLYQSNNLSLELLRQVIFAQILSIVRKFQLFHGDIILFVGRLVNIRAGTRTNLLLKVDITDINPEVILTHMELLGENATSLLRLGHLTRVERLPRANAATLAPFRSGTV